MELSQNRVEKADRMNFRGEKGERKMKKVFNNKTINKLTLGLLGLVLSVMIASSLGTDGSKVLAASGDQVLDTSTDFLTVEYTADDAKTKIGTSAPAQPTKSGYEDWLFAGWYKNIECTRPIQTKNEATDTCYAKFVPTDVLSVKCQVLADTTSESEKTNMRFTTSIDTNQYWNVGFAISRDGKSYNYTTRFAYERIEASEATGVAYEYSPKVIGTKSEAFVTYTIKNIPNTEGNRYFDTVFMARPYWTTWDGVRVYGVTKYASVSDSYNDVVNIPVKVEKSATAYTAEDFGVKEGANTTSQANVAVRYNLNQNYAALVMTGKTGLSSATKYTVTHAEQESVYIHRNLETKYGGTEKTADRTWYDVYVDENDNLTEDEFVVATNADLYGLSYIVMRDGFTFADKKIYVVSDIVVNKGRAANDGWHKVDEDGETVIEGATSYGWIKIGTATYPFEGLFDGQGHSISGVVYKEDEAYLGLFGKTAYGSKVQNLQLKNSYFEYNGTSTGYVYVGSIAGCGNGSFESIKSEAIVLTSTAGKGFGGIIGYKGANGDIIDCWYAGQLSLGSGGIQGGGIVGAIRDGAIVNMKYCHNGGTLISTTTSTNGSGGLCGFMESQSYLTVENCLSTGSISCANNWHGSIIGRLNNATIEIDDTYTIQTDGCQRAVRYGSGTVIYNGKTYTTNLAAADYSVPIETLKGCDGYYNDTIALDFTNYWGPVADGTPELLTFSDNALDVWEGKGTSSSPWMIYTEEELKTLATLTTLSESPYNFTDKYVQLGADIMVVNADTLTDLQKKATAKDNWTPIGSSTNPFEGTFNGDMKTISGLYYQGSDEYIGLFGWIGNNSTVQNLKLSEACYFESELLSANANIGSVAGCLRGTLDTIKSEATVVSTGNQNGGIVGAIYYPGGYDANIKEVKISNVWFGGTLDITASAGRFSGGIVGAIQGLNRKIDIEHCLVTGTMKSAHGETGNTEFGGVVGRARQYKKLSISDSLVTSVVQNLNADSGAIIGWAELPDYTLHDVYAVKDDTYIHDITGTGTTDANKPNTNTSANYSVLDVALNGYDGWYNTTLDFETSWSAISEDTPQLTCFKNGTALDTLAGKGQESSPWMINNAEDLKLLASLAKSTYNFSEKYLELGAKIAVNDGTMNWTPIGTATNAFAGNFNGTNKTISGLYYKGNGTNIGLFGYVGATGNISNVTLADSSFESTSTGAVAIGGIAGYIKGGTYTNLKVADSVTLATNGERAGGIVGEINWADVVFDTCWSAATIYMNGESARQVGGIVGRIYSGGTNVVQMKHCLNTGNIISTTSKEAHAGGLCGVLHAGNADKPVRLEISDSLNTDSIESQSTILGNIGTLIGTVNSGAIKLNQVYGIKGYELFGTNNGTLDTLNSADYVALVEDAMTSDASWLNLKLDYTNHWYPVLDSTPELKAFPVSEELVTWEGEGTEESPWIFGNGEGFNDFKRFVQAAKTHDFAGKYVQLGTDIVINECESVEDLKDSKPDNWTPIGNATTPFAGNFNGKGHTISGIYCTGSTAEAGLGLFGYTAAGSQIYDFTIAKSYMAYTGTGNAYLGSVSGAGAGQFTLIKSEAELESSGSYNGGIIGAVQANSDITNCSFVGSIDLGTDKGQYAGGLVGIIENSAVVNARHCLNKGNLSGDRTSGIVGLGGLCAYVYSGTLDVKDTLSVGNISGTGNRIAHLVSRFETGGTASFTNTYYSKISGITHGSWGDYGSIAGAQGFELAALKGDGGWLNTDLDFAGNWNPIVNSTPELKAFPSGTVATMWEGEGTESSPWIIKNADELWRLTNISPYHNYANEFIKLGADIAINEGTLDEIKAQQPKNWAPIGTNANGKRFEGTFDGNGKTISGLYYNGDSTGVGLFGTTGNNAEIKNLKITNSYFESSSTGNVLIGSIAGIGYGTFENIMSKAEVVCHGSYGGGIVGGLWTLTSSADFDDCWFDGTLRVEGTAAEKCGGILGGTRQPVNMTNCLNSGDILISTDVETRRVGGLCGFTQEELNITNCLNAKSITIVSGPVSAILGCAYSNTTTLTNVYAIVGDGPDQAYNTNGYCGDINTGASVTVVDESWAVLTHEQLLGENAKTYAKGLFGTDTHWKVGDLYPVLNMAGETYDPIPKMSVSTTENTSTKLTGDGNFVTTVTGTTKANYDNYLSLVAAADFVKVADNAIDGSVYSTTYTREKLVLCVTYFSKTSETTISYYEGAASEHLVYDAEEVAANADDAVTTMSMMELFAYGNSFVIQLKNGHFLISDGGMEYEIEYLLDYLDELTPGDAIPVVDGWFITHAHEDHCGAFNAFYDKEDLASRVYVEGVYYSSPNEEVVLTNAGGGQSKDYVLSRVIKGVVRNSKGEPTTLYRPQTGQRYYFNDTTIDILLAQEQLSVDATDANISYRSNLNSSSTICLFTSENQTCLLSGDLEETGFDWLFENYNETMFSTLDFFTLNHHGFNTGETIANTITANTVLLTLKDKFDDRCAEYIEVLIGKAKESMAWGNGTVVFTFPHTAGNKSYKVLTPNTWKYHEGVERPIQENID